MKTTIYILSLMLGIAMLGSCSSDDMPEINEEDNSLLQITADIMETRSIMNGTYFSYNDTIGIILQKGTEFIDCYAVYNNNGSWTLDKVIDLKEFNVDASVMAYYPYHHDGMTGLTVADNKHILQMHPFETDYLRTLEAVKVNKNNCVAALSLSHLMSRLTLNITKDANYKGDGILSRSAITDLVESKNEVIEEGTTYNAGHQLVDSKNVKTFYQDHNAKLGATVDYLVIPQDITTQASVYLTIDGVEYRVAFPKNITLEAGKKYNFNINVTATPEKVYLTMSQGQISLWNNHNQPNITVEKEAAN